jgi:diguanylate cyclase (GGDEF)-like protein
MRVPRFRDLSLVTRFALASFLPLALISFVLGQFFEDHIQARAVRAAEQAGVVVATSLRSQVPATSSDRELPPAAVERLDELFASVRPSGVAHGRIADLHGGTLYSVDHDQIGRRFPFSGELLEAYGGNVSSRLVEGRSDAGAAGDVVGTFIPIYGRGGAIAGVLQLDFVVGSLAGAIERDTRRMYAVLWGGFALLYALLLPIVGHASRKLRRQAKDNEYLALHDHLTGLANRLLFADRIEHAIRQAKRHRETIAILLLDLDRFKEVNDTLGHQSGDALLEDLAKRFRELVRESDTVARLGGDEFALLLPRATEAGTLEIVERIQAVFAEPFVLEGLPLEVEASIGVALYPVHGEDADTLLRRADVAMYVAKRTRSGYAVYDLDHDDYNPQRLALVAQLRRALKERELVVYFQPKGSLPEGRVDSAEALVRWDHPTRGLLPPQEFVPVAQHTGLIDMLTAYVLEEALVQCREWRRNGHNISVSVNVATRNLLDLEFPLYVRDLLQELGLEPSALELEITESAVLTDPRRAVKVLEQLRDLGVKLSVDDFGTGYSSFTYLSQLPVDTIKIDKSFVLVMAEDEQGAALVRSTIDVARNLSLEVVAEGVETKEVWTQLSALGCDSAQGFYLSRPLPSADFASWLERTQGGSAGYEARRLRALPSA